MKILLVGNHSQKHCSEVHWAATLEDLGHSVTRIQENEIKPGELVDKVRGHDLFLWVRTWAGFVTLDDLKAIRALGIPSVNYHLDLFVSLQRQDGLDTDPRWRCDFVFTPDGDPASQVIFESKGINHHFIRAGVYKAECEYGHPRQEFMQDVIFVGSGNYMHKEWPYRGQLLQWLRDNYGNRFGKYGQPERTVRNQELNDLYASAKIVIGDSLCPNFNKPFYTSDRVYETLGRSGFIIHPYIRGMEEEFTDRENIVFYEYGNFTQLKDLIDYYLEHNDERERIRKAGHEYVKANCTYHNRLQQMLDVVLGEKGSPQRFVNSMNKLGRVNEAMFGPDEHSDKQYIGVDYGEPHGDRTVISGKNLKINLGAGQDQFKGFVNVDLVDLPGIDVVHNLMNFPYPFEDESAEEIRAVDVIEHLANYTPDNRPTIIAFVEECHRILKSGGTLYIQTPGWKADFLWIDPTHVRGFDPQSMDFFDLDKPFGKTTGFYSKAKFSVRCEELPNHNLRFWMVKR